MAIKVKYFGAIAEETGTSEELLELNESGTDIDAFKTFCEQKYKTIADMTFQISVNKTLVKSGALKDGDEVALLPPFAGG